MAISVNATTTQCGQVTLTWSNPSGTVYNQIWRGVIQLYSGSAKTSHVDTVSPGDYSYTVEAYDDTWTPIDYGNADGRSMGAPNQNPSSVSASDGYCDRITISWTHPQFEEYYRPTKSRISRNGVHIAEVDWPGNSYTDYPPAGSYWYDVYYINDCGGSPGVTSDGGTRLTAPQYAAGSFDGSDDQCGQITLSWSNPSEPSYSARNGWKIYRSGILIADIGPNETSYIDTVAAGIYNYQITPYNSCGNGPSAYGDGTSLTTPQYAAENFAASEGICYQVNLNWTNPTEPSYSARSGWKILRDGVQIATVGPNATSYTDYPPAGTYTYSIKPYNACGDGPSASDSGTAAGIPTTNVSNLSLQLLSGPAVKLNYTAGNGTYRRIYRSVNNNTSYAWLADTTNPSTYTDTTVINRNIYYYKMREANDCGEMESYSNEASIYVGNIYEDIITETVGSSDSIQDTLSAIDIVSEAIGTTDSIQDLVTYNDIITESVGATDSMVDIYFRINRFKTYVGDISGNIAELSSGETADSGAGFDFKWVSKVFDIFQVAEEKDLFKTIKRVEIKYRDLGAQAVYFYASPDGGLTWIPASNNPIRLAGQNDGKIKSVFADIFLTGKNISFMVQHGSDNETFSLLDLEVTYEIRGHIKQEAE